MREELERRTHAFSASVMFAPAMSSDVTVCLADGGDQRPIVRAAMLRNWPCTFDHIQFDRVEIGRVPRQEPDLGVGRINRFAAPKAVGRLRRAEQTTGVQLYKAAKACEILKNAYRMVNIERVNELNNRRLKPAGSKLVSCGLKSFRSLHNHPQVLVGSETVNVR